MRHDIPPQDAGKVAVNGPTEPDPIPSLHSHPAFAIADQLARYIGIPRDFIQFTEFLSLAAGKMAVPLNLDIFSDQPTVDLYIANKILDVLHEQVARIDTHKAFRSLEKEEFHDLAAVLIRGNHQFLYRDVSEYTARLLGGDFRLPSLWRISDHVPMLPAVPSALRLMTQQAERDLSDFGRAFASYKFSEEEWSLRELLHRLPLQPHYANVLACHYKKNIGANERLVLERLLLVFAAIRVHLSGSGDAAPTILHADYGAARDLLLYLPFVPVDRNLSPQALVTAEKAWKAAVENEDYQLPLPDRSGEGNKWFTRQDGVNWTGLGYTTVKKHLGELENEGILVSTVADNNRDHGRQIHYRFPEQRAPPFEWMNPFEGLPDLTAPAGAAPGAPK